MQAKEFQPYPYLVMMMNCMLWVNKDSILFTTTNGAGMASQAVYISIFLFYCGGMNKLRRNIVLYLVAEVIAVAAVVLITLFAIQNLFGKQTFVGVICNIFNIAMYGAPSLVIPKVIETRSVEYMPGMLSFYGFINAGTWTAYSDRKTRSRHLRNSGLGMALCASQLIVYAMYLKSTPVKPSYKRLKFER
ncbi:hypothetical protein Bca101_041483 [Brassica carinata]